MIEKLFENKIEVSQPRNTWTTVSSNVQKTLPDSYTNEECVNTPTVFRAMDIRASAISKLPFKVYKRSSDGKEEVDDVISYLLNVRPNPLMTPTVFKKGISQNIDIYGDAFVWVQTSKGVPSALYLLNNETCQLSSKNGKAILKFKFNDVEKVVKYENILHFTDVTLSNMQDKDDIKGVPKIKVAMQTIVGFKSSCKLLNDYYQNGVLGGGILTTPEQLSPEDKQVIKQAWMNSQSGVGKGIAVVDANMQYQNTTMNFRDMCLVELSKLSVEDISRVFAVPLHMLSNLDKSSFSNIQQQSLDFYMNSIQPLVTGIEEEMTFKLYTSAQQLDGYCVKADTRVAMRSDDESRANYYKTMLELGVYSINDVLKLEDRPSIDGGDKHRVSLNYVDIAIADKYQLQKSGGDMGEE